MKKLTLLLFLTSTTLFLSCGSDDNDPSIGIDETQITGEWKLEAFRLDNGQTFVESEGTRVLFSEFSSFGKDFNTIVTFSEDPQTFTSDGGYTTVLTNTVLGQETTTQEIPTPGFAASGEWIIENGNLILDVQGTEESFKISGLNSQTLLLEKALNESIPFSGFTQVSTGMTFFTFTKQ
ncbi:hypothetical protein D1818_10455 [Aquimarina sp. BL5]|uniref:hypothetical protein n=1 Tax=Aquimarina sp. BL5 TaxID=1714860 RepID=UPI000E50B7DD|nr:hypothetical protein [Aquimarina sp. BL5]AXT51226.1 hypothetical protein D1818_10455 [Aquimarina sp. BL5]RKN06232.1 hypothetical protein D7036_09260 [Aquimarina sp. BL5]